MKGPYDTSVRTIERRPVTAVLADRVRRLVPSPSQLAWGLPVFVFMAIRLLGQGRVTLLLGAILGVGVLILITRHASGALLLLIAIMPFQVIILAALYRLGVPGGLVRSLGAYRDVIVAGLAVAALRKFRHSGRRADALDVLAVVYVGLVTLYLLAPRLFVQGPTIDFPGPPEQLDIRFLAYRVDVMFVVLFMAVRHGTFAPDLRMRIMRLLLIVGAVVAGVTVFEFVFSSTWDRFCVETIQVPRYWREILDYSDVERTTTILSHITVAGRELVRPGSVFLDPLHLGFFLLLPFAAAVELTMRQHTRLSYAVGGLTAFALLFANVRSAQVGAVVIVILAVRPAPGRNRASRLRLVLILAAGLLALVPAAASSGFTDRATAVSQTDDQSTNAHVNSLRAGITALGEYPLGLGLGTQPGVGSRFAVKTNLTSENSYIGVGNELGIPTMLAFTLLVILLLRQIGRARARDTEGTFSSAVRAAAVALSIGGLFLHVWLYYAAASTLWALAGLAIGVHDRSRPPVLRRPLGT